MYSFCVLDDLAREIGLRPVVVLRRRRTDDLQVDAHRIHVGQPLLDTRQLRKSLRQHRRVVVCQRVRPTAESISAGSARFSGAIRDESLGGERQHVAMKVHHEMLPFEAMPERCAPSGECTRLTMRSAEMKGHERLAMSND